MNRTYTLWRGSNLTIPFFVTGGTADPATLEVAAVLKSALDQDAVAVPLAVTYRPAVGDVAQGWNISISEEISSTLEVGPYRVQLIFSPDSNPEFSQLVRVSVREGAAS